MHIFNGLDNIITRLDINSTIWDSQNYYFSQGYDTNVNINSRFIVNLPIITYLHDNACERIYSLDYLD